MIDNKDIRECYLEDTIGRKYHNSIVTKNRPMRVNGENGEVTTTNLDAPMSWHEFKKLSDATKTTYIVHLVDKYNVGITELVDMLGCVRSTFYNNVTKPLALGELFERGHKMTANQKAKWSEFLGIEDDTPELVEVEEVKVPTKYTMGVKSAGFVLEGKFDFIKLTALINALVNEGDDCVVSVHISTTDRE